jgi:DNA replication protein DnaD
MLTKIQQDTLDTFIKVGSIKGTAKEMGKSPSTIRECIESLEKRGLVPWLASGGRPEHLNMVKTTVQLNADGTIEREWRRLEPAAQQLSDIVEGLCDKARGKGKVVKRKERKTDTKDILFEMCLFDAMSECLLTRRKR